MTFTKRDTNICKGIAILFMILHHVVGKWYLAFDPGWYAVNSENIWQMIILFFSTAGKVCVSLLTILSGYGLAKSYQKFSQGPHKAIRFTASRLVQFYSIYWSVFIFSLIERIMNNDMYGNAAHFFADLFGIAFRLGFQTYFGWFVSAIIALYIVFPALYRLVHRFKVAPVISIMVLTAAFIAIAGTKVDIFLFYLPEFVIGIYAAESGILDRIRRTGSLRSVAASLLLAAAFALRLVFGLNADLIFAITIILFEISVLSEKEAIADPLSVLGGNSANMWLLHGSVHTLMLGTVRLKFCRTVLLTFAQSRVIEWAKGKTGWSRLTVKLRETIKA